MVIIIPGWKHDAAQWQTVSHHLAHRGVEHTVLDMPGFGTAPYDDTLQTLGDLAQWCRRQIITLQRTSGTPLVIVGHSCGGRIGLQLVAKGLNVQQLILCGSPNLYRPSRKTQLIKLLVALTRPVKSFIPQPLREKLRSDDYTAVRGDAMQQLYLNVVRDDQTNLLPSVSVPVQLLWGADDDAAPVWIARELHRKLSDSHLDIIPHVGHNIHHEKPALLAARIATYVGA